MEENLKNGTKRERNRENGTKTGRKLRKWNEKERRWEENVENGAKRK